MQTKHIYPIFEQPIQKLIQDPNTFVWNFTQERRVGNRHPSMHVLGDYCYISVGMVINADEKVAKGAFKKADLISNSKDAIHCKKYIEGKDLERYAIKRHRFLEWNTERCPGRLRRPTFPELYTNKKLLINALGDLKASIDDGEEYHCEQQVRMALLWKDLDGIENKSIISSVKKLSSMSRYDMSKLSEKVSLKYLLGLLNSTYATILLKDIRGGDYHIVPEHIRNIPIPDASKEQQKAIVDIVDDILDTKKKDSMEDTNILEQQIDLLVYHLYGLTYDEVLIVDPQTPITREEYGIL